MKTCLYCKKEIDDSNNVCPYCGSAKFVENNQFPNYQTQQTQQVPQDVYDAAVAKKKRKKNIIIAIVLILIFGPMIFAMIASLIPCKHEYKEDVVEATYSMAGERKFTCEKCDDSYTEEIPMLLSVEVEVLDKYTYVDEAEPTVLANGMELSNSYLNQSYVVMDIEIKNVTDKDIAVVKGYLNIDTGTASLDVSCTFEDDIIPAGESVVIEGYGFSTKTYGVLNNYDADKIYSTPHDKLTYEFEVADITYADEMEKE